MHYPISRPPRLGISLSLLALVGFLIAGCAGPQQQSAPPPVAGSFVGEVPDADAFVAVVAAGPQEEGEGGGGGDERSVRAYLCDGDQINEWFTGTAAGNELDLNSDGGALLEGNLTPDTSTGTVTLSDGRSFPFAAQLASGVAGLYDVTVSEDGQVRGSSESGGRVEGRLAGEPDGEGVYPITGTIIAPDGPSAEVEVFTEEAEPAEGRWVVLADGRVKGGKKGRPTRGFVDPDPTP